MSDPTRNRHERWVLGIGLKAWGLVGLILIALLVFVALFWMVTYSGFITDRGWWAWNGWPAIAAMAQVLAAGALVILWLQFRQLRRQAVQETANRREDLERETRLRREDSDRDRKQRREEFERAHTPVLSVVLTGGQVDGLRGTATCTLVAIGKGVVHNVEVSFWTGTNRPQHTLVKILPSIIAPSEDTFEVTWDVWKETQQCTIEVTGAGTFWQRIDFQQDGRIEPGRFLTFEAS